VTTVAAQRAVVREAVSHLGEVESPPFSNRCSTVVWYNNNVEDLGDAWPYCEAGMARSFTEAAAKVLNRERAYTPWAVQDAIDGYGGMTWTYGHTGIQPGDKVYFDWQKPEGYRKTPWAADHVEIAETAWNGSYVDTIGFNTTMQSGFQRNEGVERRRRDSKYILGFARPDWSKISDEDVPKPPTIPGTNLAPLVEDGSLGRKTVTAMQIIMKKRGHNAVIVDGFISDDYSSLVAACQEEMNEARKRCKHGRALVVDGKGLNENTEGRYPASGYTHTIEALQLGQRFNRKTADGYLDAFDSKVVRRIQRDINIGGTRDSFCYYNS
jgi:hypothetical protein